MTADSCIFKSFDWRVCFDWSLLSRAHTIVSVCAQTSEKRTNSCGGSLAYKRSVSTHSYLSVTLPRNIHNTWYAWRHWLISFMFLTSQSENVQTWEIPAFWRKSHQKSRALMWAGYLLRFELLPMASQIAASAKSKSRFIIRSLAINVRALPFCPMPVLCCQLKMTSLCPRACPDGHVTFEC